MQGSILYTARECPDPAFSQMTLLEPLSNFKFKTYNRTYDNPKLCRACGSPFPPNDLKSGESEFSCNFCWIGNDLTLRSNFISYGSVKSEGRVDDYIDALNSETTYENIELVIFAIDSKIGKEKDIIDFFTEILNGFLETANSFVSIIIYDDVLNIIRLCEVGGDSAAILFSSDIIPADQDRSYILKHLFSLGIYTCPIQKLYDELPRVCSAINSISSSRSIGTARKALGYSARPSATISAIVGAALGLSEGMLIFLLTLAILYSKLPLISHFYNWNVRTKKQRNRPITLSFVKYAKCRDRVGFNFQRNRFDKTTKML